MFAYRYREYKVLYLEFKSGTGGVRFRSSNASGPKNKRKKEDTYHYSVLLKFADPLPEPTIATECPIRHVTPLGQNGFTGQGALSATLGENGCMSVSSVRILLRMRPPYSRSPSLPIFPLSLPELHARPLEGANYSARSQHAGLEFSVALALRLGAWARPLLRVSWGSTLALPGWSDSPASVSRR